MKNIYNAKNYFEEILLGSNNNGIGFINESLNGYITKSFNYSGESKYHDYSSEVISVGLLRENILEIGISSSIANSPNIISYIKNNVSKKLSLNESSFTITPKRRYRPQFNGHTLNLGQKVGHRNLAIKKSYGTLGGFIYPRASNKNLIIVSNNHVLADCNNGRIGDQIYCLKGQPVQIGNLKKFHPISTTSTNEIDLAIAELNGYKGNFNTSTSRRGAIIGESVTKKGATTGLTKGIIRSLHYTSRVNYDQNVAVFVDQIQITSGFQGYPFSDGGDSGSLIISEKDSAMVGLLFAGNGVWTLANHQAPVIAKMRAWGYPL